MLKKTLIWIIAIIITIGAAIYQRKTGPTYPKKAEISLNGKTINFQLPRSYVSGKDCPVEIKITDSNTKGSLFYKRFPVDEPYIEIKFKYENDTLKSFLPGQPPAGKLAYYLVLKDQKKETRIAKNNPVIIRFKGEVPVYALMPHIILIFLAMLLSNVTGLMAIWKIPGFRLYTLITFIVLIAGGLIFGPIVQKFAFGEYWTGIPKGWDLTDNKTLIASIGWLTAVIGNWKKDRPYLSLVASILMLIIFLIPHSFLGSELNYTTGEIKTG